MNPEKQYSRCPLPLKIVTCQTRQENNLWFTLIKGHLRLPPRSCSERTLVVF
ncbi:hypothetical protein HMPREF0201_04846 [Cedecea davisae DSM 4568]|uniref:Uncharacterized protein n=1 Tax=Cedecea davisae DSM 4568 TaxID=566551 RepID=S3JGG3_9ENTR|nr:hypothetical protein HMPREF0201_04846 [Cedecea davisae DSM 4568]